MGLALLIIQPIFWLIGSESTLIRCTHAKRMVLRVVVVQWLNFPSKWQRLILIRWSCDVCINQLLLKCVRRTNKATNYRKNPKQNNKTEQITKKSWQKFISVAHFIPNSLKQNVHFSKVLFLSFVCSFPVKYLHTKCISSGFFCLSLSIHRCWSQRLSICVFCFVESIFAERCICSSIFYPVASGFVIQNTRVARDTKW